MIRRLTDKTFKDGNISALKLNFAQQLHTHDMVTGHNAPPSCIVVFLTVQIVF